MVFKERSIWLQIRFLSYLIKIRKCNLNGGSNCLKSKKSLIYIVLPCQNWPGTGFCFSLKIRREISKNENTLFTSIFLNPRAGRSHTVLLSGQKPG